MRNNKAVDKLAQVISYGVPITSILVITGVVTDPVNVTKLSSLVAFSIPVLVLLLAKQSKSLISDNRVLFVYSSLFVIAACISVANSNSPVSQNVYGTYGRSTGFLAYFALVVFLLGAATLNQVRHHKAILIAFLATGMINVCYCAWVLAFGDFIGWNNPYGEILGLFGNPNFIGAFLGMFLVGTASVLLQSDISTGWRVIGALVIAITFFEIVKSRAIQGIVVTAGGLALVGLFYLWSRRTRVIWIAFYLISFSILATLSVLGALQRGPFDFVYKRSVSLRGTYWESGISMGLQNPISGVGMDAYGDWYRRARPSRALTDTPGIETVTNAAHNVVIDLFSYGGFPLLISYLAILSLGLSSIFKVLRRRSRYDGIFVAFAVVWVCYQVQSLISINQIGLAIWGWVLTGALISYERISLPNSQNQKVQTSAQPKSYQKTPASQEILSPGLLTAVGFLIGLMVALPPLSADIKWFTALKSRNAAQVELALIPSYFNPSSSYRYNQAINLLSTSNLPEQALKYARLAVKFNPDDFTAWLQLYWLDGATDLEKEIAKSNLERLDPKNPDVTNPNPQ